MQSDGKIWNLPWKTVQKEEDDTVELKIMGKHAAYTNSPRIVEEPDSWKLIKNPLDIVVDESLDPIYYSNKYPKAKFNRFNVVSCPQCHSNMTNPNENTIYESGKVRMCEKCNIIMYISFL